MLIESKGIALGKLYVPPFTVSAGEFIVLNLGNGAHYLDLVKHLSEILAGKETHENVRVHQPLTFVEHFRESRFRRNFRPITVGEYARKCGNLQIIQQVRAEALFYDGIVESETKINTLEGTPRKLLSLFASLSRTNLIVFDLAGVAPYGAQRICEIVKQHVEDGGTAVLLDQFDEMKADCTRFIVVELLS